MGKKENSDNHRNVCEGGLVTAGSKGSTINISQIVACVGQQNVEGKRIPFGFKDRSLPHYVKHDYGPDSRGFVKNSYLTGLTPQELFFHAMGGREGIIDTACKTSETGYIQRRLIKAMEDILVSYDKTVRNCCGDVIQFLYGEDSMAGEFIEDLMLPLIKMDHQSMAQQFRHDVSHPDYGKNWIPNESIRNQIRLSFEAQSVLDNEWQQLTKAKARLCTEIFPDGESKQHLPVNINRLIQFAQSRFPNESLASTNPVDIAKKVDELLDSLIVVQSTGDSDYISKEAQINATTLLNIHLRTALSSRKLMEQDKLGPQALQWLFGEIRHQFFRSMAHAGEVIGAMAAQSIGEPATQMTLNTFHFAGVGSKNVTLGVPRLKELINVATTVKTPSLSVYLREDIAHDQEAAKTVQAHLEHTTLEKVISYAQIVYDPNPTETIIEADKQWVREYYEFPDDEDLATKLGPWVLRIQLIDKLITDKQLTMKEIGEKICAEFSSDELDCIWTDDNSEDLVIRIRIKSRDANRNNGGQDGDDGEDENRFLQRLMSQFLCNITLRGIPGISKVYMREEKSQVYDATSGNFEPKSQWVLDTDGCNLAAVLCVPEVDPTRTVSNDIKEVFQVFGIEAVRRALLRELRAVISFDGSYVNYRHLATLCDVMTQKGHLMSITRSGINRVDKGCLSKCSFEETVEILMGAAAFAETDHLRGVTENVMFGQLGAFGTGLCDLVIDEEKLKGTNPNFDPASMALGLHGGYDDIASPDSSQLVTPSSSIETQPGRDFVTSPFSPLISPMSPAMLLSSPSMHNPIDLGGSFSPVQQSPSSPYSPNAMSPIASPIGGVFSPAHAASFSPSVGTYSVTSPQYSPTSPVYSVSSPAVYSPTSSTGGSSRLRLSPAYSPTSPIPERVNYSPTSPSYSPTSPVIVSPTSPESGSLCASPTSPHYNRIQSPGYSPGSPVYFPTSPTNIQSPGAYSLTSPNYSPTSPSYALGDAQANPLSPDVVMTSPRYDPQSMQYGDAASPTYSPTSPIYHAQGQSHTPQYSPTSPTIETMYDAPQSPKRETEDDLMLGETQEF